MLFAVVGALVAAYLAYRGNRYWPYAAGGGGVFLVLGFAGRPLLRPVQIAWMVLAHALAWINTRLLLGLFFFLVMTPVGLVMRMTGKDSLQRRFDRSAPTYWIKREKKPMDRNRYQRLF
jgi:hypothetical protein